MTTLPMYRVGRVDYFSAFYFNFCRLILELFLRPMLLRNSKYNNDCIPIIGSNIELFGSAYRKEKTPSISVNSLNLFESMFTIMSYLFKDEQRFLQDYRMSLIKGMTTVAAEV